MSSTKNNEERHEEIPRMQGFLWRARQYSNLRPSLFVVILIHRLGGTLEDTGRQNSAFIGSLYLFKGHRGTGRDTRLRSKYK